jgi:hypothetical protein
MLSRSSELVVLRAAGISVWQFTLPAMAVAFLLGVLFVLLYNPVAATARSELGISETTGPATPFGPVSADRLSERGTGGVLAGSGTWTRDEPLPPRSQAAPQTRATT